MVIKAAVADAGAKLYLVAAKAPSNVFGGVLKSMLLKNTRGNEVKTVRCECESTDTDLLPSLPRRKHKEKRHQKLR